MRLDVIVLAAGRGFRMRSELPKVLHKLGGKSLLEHVVITASKLKPNNIYVVGSNELLATPQAQELSDKYQLTWVSQKQRLGTAHAAKWVLPYLKNSKSRVLILYGDVPLVTVATLKQLLSIAPLVGVGLITAFCDEPTGLGRIIRNERGGISSIIEHRDATIQERKVKEVNSGIMVINSEVLQKFLPLIGKRNTQGEYYLTDIIKLLVKNQLPAEALQLDSFEEVSGINDKRQLAIAERNYQKKLVDEYLLKGLTLLDPNRFDVRGEFEFGSDVTIDVNVVCEGVVKLGSGSKVEANTLLRNVVIGDNVLIKANCVIEDAVIKDHCIVGPFARIRPGSNLGEGVKVGNFVEIKNSVIKKSSKINHLSYVGDTLMGTEVNIGAGTITCNYDGLVKHRTTIEDGVFVGSNVALVAPVKLGKRSKIGAGSTITKNVANDTLVVARVPQAEKKSGGRVRRKKRG